MQVQKATYTYCEMTIEIETVMTARPVVLVKVKDGKKTVFHREILKSDEDKLWSFSEDLFKAIYGYKGTNGDVDEIYNELNRFVN